MLTTVDALLPLSLLEAVRNVDTPAGDYDSEYVAELKSKRLGLSDTVYSQIRRYTDAVKRRQRTAQDEAVALAKLIGRRNDADEVFKAAGRHLAREAYQTIPQFTRELLYVVPSIMARPIALRRARRIAERYLNGSLSRHGSSLLLEIQSSVTLEASRTAGCLFYEWSLRELLTLLIGTTGGVEHIRCIARGEGKCAWRAEWRPVSPETASND